MKAATRSDPPAGKFLAKALISGIMIGTPLEANAVPLGTHTTCAWPTCTSQLDILKDSAPALVSQVERGVTEQVTARQIFSSVIALILCDDPTR
jgi:hypothetical protein